jgi:hypothetical protein
MTDVWVVLRTGYNFSNPNRKLDCVFSNENKAAKYCYEQSEKHSHYQYFYLQVKIDEKEEETA